MPICELCGSDFEPEPNQNICFVCLMAPTNIYDPHKFDLDEFDALKKISHARIDHNNVNILDPNSRPEDGTQYSFTGCSSPRYQIETVRRRRFGPHKYKAKTCQDCGSMFTPVYTKQKLCIACKPLKTILAERQVKTQANHKKSQATLARRVAAQRHGDYRMVLDLPERSHAPYLLPDIFGLTGTADAAA